MRSDTTIFTPQNYFSSYRQINTLRLVEKALFATMFGRYWVLLKVMGIAAFRADGSGTFKYSLWFLLTGYCLTITSVSKCLYGLVYRSVIDSEASDTAKVVSLLDELVLLATSSTCLLFATVQTKNLFLITDQFNTDPSFKNFNRPSKFRFMTAVSLALLTFFLVIFELSTSTRDAFFILSTYYLKLLRLGCEVIFTSAQLTLYDFFHNLNQTLLRVAGSNQEVQAIKVLPAVDYVRGRLPNVQTSLNCLSLRELGTIHWKLCSIGRKINNTFNGQLLALFVAIFAHITTTPYFIFLSLQTAENSIAGSIAVNSGWIVAYVLQLCMLVQTCSRVTAEAGETSTIIVQKLTKPLNPENRKQMDMFLLQLVNHKLNFTVYDMFTIDLTVLTSVAGAVTTYLVILIQFQNSKP